MSKTIAFKMPPVVAQPSAESWVQSRTPETPPAAVTPSEPMKRLTIDVTEDLHKRLKTACAMKGEKMADFLRSLLERELAKS